MCRATVPGLVQSEALTAGCAALLLFLELDEAQGLLASSSSLPNTG